MCSQICFWEEIVIGAEILSRHVLCEYVRFPGVLGMFVQYVSQTISTGSCNLNLTDLVFSTVL